MSQTSKQKLQQFNLKNIEVVVYRKAIKNMNLRICRETLNVTLSVPMRLPNIEIERFLNLKKSWIEKKLDMLNSNQAVPHQLIENKVVYLFGNTYSIKIFEGNNKHADGVQKKETPRILEMQLPYRASQTFRKNVLARWYKQQLESVLKKLIETWQQRTQQRVLHWQIRNMKTRWGSCNPVQRRLSFNLKLVHYPLECIEMVVVHEFVHFFEPSHNDNFKRLMSQYLPDWRVMDRYLRTNCLGGLHESTF